MPAAAAAAAAAPSAAAAARRQRRQAQQQQQQQQVQEQAAAPPPPPLHHPAAPPAATHVAALILSPPPPPSAAAPAPREPAAPPARTGSLGFALGFDAAYELGELIGEGASGRVHLATERGTGRRVAVKVMRKRPAAAGGASSSSSSPTPQRSPSPTASSRHAAIRREAGATALASSGSPYAARLEGAYETDDEALLVLEHCAGGDLRSLLSGRAGAPLPEPCAAAVLRGVLHALAACHARGMVFGDVKPSNVCMLHRRRCEEEKEGVDSAAAAAAADDADYYRDVRLIDWGAAAPAPLPAGALAGSPLYWSPEQAEGFGGLMASGGSSSSGGGGSSGGDDGEGVLAGAATARSPGYGPEVDVWAAGVLAFQMMSGRLPYWSSSGSSGSSSSSGSRSSSGSGSGSDGGGGGGGSLEGASVPRGLRPWQLLAAIRTAPIGAWPGASAEARDLVERMLERDPTRRITAAEALEHPFFVGRGGGGDDDGAAAAASSTS